MRFGWFLSVVCMGLNVQCGIWVTSGFSILEVAVDPPYSNFFLETLQKRLIHYQQLKNIAAGYITIRQAVQV